MKRIPAILLTTTLVALMIDQPLAAPARKFSAPNLGRVPNTNSKQKFPRWHPVVKVDAIGPTYTASVIRSGQAALDSKNNLHVIAATISGNNISYYRSEFASGSTFPRRANGFSAREKIAIGQIGDADIAVGPQDKVKVVYQDGTFFNVNYTQRTGGSWTPPISIMTIGAFPQIIVDATGTSHVVAASGGALIYRNITDAGALGTQQTIPGSAASGTIRNIRLAFGADGIHALWEASNPSQFGVYYSFRTYDASGGTWFPVPVVISTNGSKGDIFVDPADSNAVHLAWMDGGTSKVVYHKHPTGAWGAITTEAVSSGTVGNDPITYVRIAVDALKQPHIVWQDSGTSTMAYAAKLVRGDISYTPAVPWPTRQEPTELLDHGPIDNFAPKDLLISKNGTLHVFGGLSTDYDVMYTRSVDFNLGIQDALAMQPVGPGAVANLTNGNLFMSFPLFSSQGGYGFSTSVSLLHNSLSEDSNVISQGWSHNYHMYLVDSQTNVKDIVFSTLHADVISLFMPDGQSIVFKWKDTDPGSSPAAKYHVAEDEFGYFGRIERQADSISCEYLLTTKSGVKYTFKSDGKLREIKDTNGNLETLTYNPEGRLQTIQDSTNRSTTFAYDSSGRIDKINDPASPSREYKFNYDVTTGKLLTVVRNNTGVISASDKQTWTFAYHTADSPAPNYTKVNLISQVTTPRGNVHKYFYYLDNRFRASRDPVLTQGSVDVGTQHPDQTVDYYDAVDPSVFAEDGNGYVVLGGNPPTIEPRATFTNRRSKTTTVVFEQRKGVVRASVDHDAFAVYRNVSVSADEGNFRNTQKVKDKLGNETVYQYRHQAAVGGTEKPRYVKDLLAKVFVAPPNSSPATAPDMANPFAEYTYSDNIFRMLTSKDGDKNTTKYHYDTASQAPAEPAQDIQKGNLTEVAYPAVGEVIASERYTYDTQGRVVTQASPENVSAGVSSTFSYGDGTTGLVTQIYRPDHSLPEQMAYDTMGNMTSHTLPMGGITQITYDGLFRVSTQTQPTGDETASTTMVYDLDSNVDTVSGPGPAFTDNNYDELGRLILTKVTASPGVVLSTKYAYDSEGNTREVYDPKLKLTTSTYDNLNRLDIETRPGAPGPSIVTDLDYDANGNVTRRAVGSQATTYTYYARNNVNTTTQAIGAIADKMSYNARNLVVTSLHTESGVTKCGTKNVYDGRGRVEASSQLTDFVATTGFTSFYAYDKNSNVTRVTDPTGKTRSYDFDRADRQVRTRDNLVQITSETVYNDNDLSAVRKTAEPHTGALIVSQTCTYNLRNELKTTSDYYGNTSAYTYNALGQQVLRQLPTAGTQVCFEKSDYDYIGRLLGVTRDPNGATPVSWGYEYDENGNRTRIRDPRGNIYQMKYDDANRMIELQYPAIAGISFVESWAYDDRGNLLYHIDPEGKTAQMGYDLLNRLTSEVHTKAGVQIANITRTYDGSSNLLEVLDTVTKVKISFTDDVGLPGYDKLNRLTNLRWFLEFGTSQQIMWKEIYYTKADGSPGYDNAGNLVRMKDPEGHVFDYDYDFENRLTQIRRTKAGGTTATIATFTYYGISGLRRDVTFQGGTLQTYQYDFKSRLASLETSKVAGPVLARFDYTYDGRDRRTQARLQHLQTVIDYTYDVHDRLLSETWTGNGSAPPPPSNNLQTLTFGNISLDSNTATTTPGSPASVPNYTGAFTYDAGGNRLTKVVNGTTTTYGPYDAQNRLTQEVTSGVTTTYGYDKNGNQTSRAQGTTQELFAYDYMNRVKSYQKLVSGSTTTSYLYRTTPTGERLAKVNLLATSDNEEWYMYDGQDVTADYVRSTTSSNSGKYQVKRTYVNGRTIDSKIARVESGSTETVYFYLGDALGSVHEMIDTAGTVTRRVLDTAWGEPLAGFTPLTTTLDRYDFTQRENDSESALMHYRARSYDPRTGRFIQSDPAPGHRISAHYIYADNAPLEKRDPTGHFARKVHAEMTINGNPKSADTKGETIAEVVKANIEMDFPTTYSSPDHFDNSDFARGVELIESRYKAIAQDAKSVTEARQIFGRILHSIQDFYSHSNYVESYILSVNPGVEGIEKMKMTGKIPLWDRKIEKKQIYTVPAAVPVSPNGGMPKMQVVYEVRLTDDKAFGFSLFSGTYPFESPAKVSHKDLNKDYDETTVFTPEDSVAGSFVGVSSTRGKLRLQTGETLHKVARDVAQRQTTAEFERFFSEAKKNPNLKDADVLK